MPRGDGTGPMGMGPMTGRGAGYCAGYTVPGYANPGCGFGRGYGRGRGFGKMQTMAYMPGFARNVCGFPYNQAGPMPEVDERTVLNSQVEHLEKQIKQMRSRLKDLEDGD